MATYNFSPIGNESQQFFGAPGANFPANAPLNGGFLNTFQAGTNMPIATLANNLGSVQNSTTMQLGPDGRFAGAIWLLAGQGYKFQLTDSTGFQIWIIDNVVGINDISNQVVNVEWVASGAVPTFSNATTFTTPGNTTGTFQVGRRVKATVTAGIVYGSVLTSTFAVSTTVVLTMDTGMALDNGLTVVQVALLGEINPSVPSTINYAMTLGGALTLSNASSTYAGALRIGTNSNQPAFRAHRTTNQTSGTTLIFDTVDNQNGSGYNNSTGVFTAPVTGWYIFSANFDLQNTSGGAIGLTFNLVANAINVCTYVLNSLPNNGSQTVNMVAICFLSSTNTVSVTAGSAFTGTIVLVGGSGGNVGVSDFYGALLY